MDERGSVSDKKLESREFFDKAAQSYDGHRYAEQARWIHHRILASMTPFSAVLDVGCGTGTFLTRLKRANAALAGADLSSMEIEEARKKLGDWADLRAADAESLPWESAVFDLARVYSKKDLERMANEVGFEDVQIRKNAFFQLLIARAPAANATRTE